MLLWLLLKNAITPKRARKGVSCECNLSDKSIFSHRVQLQEFYGHSGGVFVMRDSGN